MKLPLIIVILQETKGLHWVASLAMTVYPINLNQDYNYCSKTSNNIKD